MSWFFRLRARLHAIDSAIVLEGEGDRRGKWCGLGERDLRTYRSASTYFVVDGEPS